MGIEELQATRKRMIEDLINGKEIATRLQTLLRNPVRDEEQRVLFDELALQIWNSFNVNLSVLRSATMNQIDDASAEGSIFSAESKKSPVVKDRRGGYKRRKTCDSLTKVSETTEDGRAWRKYGQKNIMNSEYPRCYYRCTNKYQGCKALKQVQRISKENPLLYQITYFNQHTCKEIVLGAPTELRVDLDPVEPNLISFKATTVQSKQTHQTPTSVIIKKDTQSSGDNICGGNSAMGAYWQEIIMSSYQHDHQVVAGFQSRESTSFHGLDDMLEVNQLGDIDNIQFDY